MRLRLSGSDHGRRPDPAHAAFVYRRDRCLASAVTQTAPGQLVRLALSSNWRWRQRHCCCGRFCRRGSRRRSRLPSPPPAVIVSLGFNLNPFMKFDGYYLLGDVSWCRQPPFARVCHGALEAAPAHDGAAVASAREFRPRHGPVYGGVRLAHLDLSVDRLHGDCPARLSLLFQGSRNRSSSSPSCGIS